MPLLTLLALAFLAGAAMASRGVPPAHIALPAAVLAGVRLAATRSRRQAGAAEIIALAVLVGLGGWLYAGGHARLAPLDLAPHAGRLVSLEGVIVGDPVRAGAGQVVVLRVRYIGQGQDRTPARGLVQCRLGPKVRLEVGDRVLVRGHLRRPRRAGNPGEFDARMYLAARGVHWSMDLLPGSPVEVTAGSTGLLRRLARVRASVRHGLDQVFTPPAAQFYRRVTVGDRTQDPEGTRAFREAGVGHLLSISGLHVGFVVAGVAAMAHRLPISALAADVLVSAMTVSYVALAGGEAPAVRAGLMTLAARWSVPLGRRHEASAAIGLAALVLVLVAPANLHDVGFQLSFAATTGLTLLAGPIRRRLPAFPGRRLVATCVAAQLSILPITLRHGHDLVLPALVANLVLIPLAGVVIPLGLVLGAVAGLIPGLPAAGPQLARLLSAPAELLLAGAGWFARIPLGAIHIPALPLSLVFALYLALLSLTGRVRPTLPLAAAVLLVCHAGVTAPAGRLEVTFLEVGRGDATLIRCPSGTAVLLAGGGMAGDRPAGERVVAMLRRTGVRRLDYLILTTLSTEGAGGCMAGLAGFPVGVVLEGQRPGLATAASGDELGRTSGSHAPRRQFGAGDRLLLGRGRAGKVGLTVLSPGPGGNAGPGGPFHGVLRLTYGQTAFLFAGDGGTYEKRRLMASDSDLRSDLLKVGHDGMSSSSLTELLVAVRPSHTVVVGRRSRRSEASAREALARLAGAGSRVWEIDRSGAIRADSDGRRVTVRPLRGNGGEGR